MFFKSWIINNWVKYFGQYSNVPSKKMACDWHKKIKFVSQENIIIFVFWSLINKNSSSFEVDVSVLSNAECISFNDVGLVGNERFRARYIDRRIVETSLTVKFEILLFDWISFKIIFWGFSLISSTYCFSLTSNRYFLPINIWTWTIAFVFYSIKK